MLCIYAKSFMIATRTDPGIWPRDARKRPVHPDPERPRLRKL